MIDDKKKQLDYLDMSKGFAIIAITLGHIYENNFIRIWLCSFHLPLFFLVTGILIKHTNTDERCMKKILQSRFERLVVPYFCFEIVAILIWMIANNEFNFAAFRWNILDTILLYQKAGATWFLPTAFVAEIVFILLLKVFKNKKSVMCVSFLLYIVPFFAKSENHFAICLLRTLTAIGFIALGYFMYEFIAQIEAKIYILFLMTIVCIVLAEINGLVDLYGLTFGNPIMYVFCSVVGSICLLLFFKKYKISIFQYFGKNSLVIMATQQIIIGNFINPITEMYNYGYVNGLLILSIVIIIEVPIIYIVNNYLPWMLGRFKKSS